MVLPPLIISPEPHPDPADPVFNPGVYETREAYLERITANPGEMVEGALPNYTAYGPDGKMVRTGLLNAPESIFQPLVPGARTLDFCRLLRRPRPMSRGSLRPVCRVHKRAPARSTLRSTTSMCSTIIFSPEDGAMTRIMKFDWNAATGGVEFAATTVVPGTILNQFSADENGEYLRVATTISHQQSGNWDLVRGECAIPSSATTAESSNSSEACKTWR